jgi:hypothetical protein
MFQICIPAFYASDLIARKGKETTECKKRQATLQIRPNAYCG